MVKLFIDVHTPGNGKTYEFRLDGGMTAADAKAQIIAGIREAENGAIALDLSAAILGDATAAARLYDAQTLTAGGVKSGHRLVLV
jgi:hypothetical protein